MMVTFVSQCEKKALNRSRRVLDAFANRIGDNTWQTVITQEGLLAVKKLLRKTASKNTAVSCHWIRSRSRTDLVWVVGNKEKFNQAGVVPVNHTENTVDQYVDKGQWQTLEVIKNAAAIAGLFHDFGKANILFQQKLKPQKSKNKATTKREILYEPYRHEWVSMRIFQAFVGSKNDEQWLEALGQVEKDLSDDCFRDGIDGGANNNHPIKSMPPFAQLVAWLILTHHRLPLKPSWKEGVNPEPLNQIDRWFESGFDALWNSYNCEDPDLKRLINKNWKFVDNGLPYQSMKWRSHACILSSKAKKKIKYIHQKDFLHDNIFTSHLARLCLMLADHHVSDDQRPVFEEWRSLNYRVYANTNRKTKELKQQLDEHLIGVAYHAKDIVKALPRLNRSLKQLPDNAFLESMVPKDLKEQFGWQDKAIKATQCLSETIVNQGFFGINMASTGKGKTLANAKIMYALGDKAGRRRFSVALGLRTLTLQTGSEYRSKLKLNNEQLAIAVGGAAVKALFQNYEDAIGENGEAVTGSESQNEYLDDNLYVDYAGTLYEHTISQWTNGNHRIEKLIQAPVLVCTIDHLVPASEGTRGGKQIAPMLRLLTSDLVIDEPDDFGLEDLPALCRLVYWAGMLGSRVLLSTATMPPSLSNAAFQAYREGWSQFAKANLVDWNKKINCAWFDEHNTKSLDINSSDSFKDNHQKFVAERIKKLKRSSLEKHRGEIISIEKIDQETIFKTFAKVIQRGALRLQQKHSQEIKDKKVSIGLVRMANINPLVAVAKELLKLEVNKSDVRIHLCVYHSRYPLAIRSYLEKNLDAILKRNSKKTNWPPNEFVDKVDSYPEKNQIFIVLASPVAEVGRDHDYDWAIIEPSSMRSIIQIAGRVLRHRETKPQCKNILLLDKNIKCLNSNEICFEKPGFEIKKNDLYLKKHDLESTLHEEQYQKISSIQRIIEPDNYKEKAKLNLVALEHKSLLETLFASESAAKLWWKKKPYWSGEIQKQQKFRDSKKDEAFYLILEGGEPKWLWKNEKVYPAKWGEISGAGFNITHREDVCFSNRVGFWFDLSAENIYEKLADDFKKDIKDVGRLFGEVRLVNYKERDIGSFLYSQNLGLYQEVVL